MLRQLVEFGKFVQKEGIHDAKAEFPVILVKLHKDDTRQDDVQFVVNDLHFIKKEDVGDDKVFSELPSSIQDYIKRKDYYVTGEDAFSSAANTSIAGKRGLITFAPHAFILKKTTIENFCKKVETHIKTLGEYLEKPKEVYGVNIMASLSSSLSLFWKKMLEKHGGDLASIKKEHKEAAYVILLYPEKIQEILFKINKEYLYSKLYVKDKDLKNVACMSCGNSDKDTYKSTYKTTNDVNKKYLRSRTRLSVQEKVLDRDKVVDIYCCKECVDSLVAFKGFCREKRITVLPLFKDSRDIKKRKELFQLGASFHDIVEEYVEKYYIDLDRAKSANTNGDLEELYNQGVDYYLYIENSKDSISYDYVTNYKWFRQPYQDFFSGLQWGRNSTLRRLEKSMREQLSLGGKKFKNYFPKSSKDTKNVLEMKFANKLFNFIYRGKSRFTLQDFREIVSTKIESLIRNQAKNQYFRKNVRDALNLFYNGKLYINASGVDKSMSKFLVEVRSKKEKILSNADGSTLNIESGEQWAYWLGQLVYYLLSLSKAGGTGISKKGKPYDKQDYSLLERFTDRVSIKQVKIMVIEFFENYKHEVKMNYLRFNMLACSVLAYEPSNDNFVPLKVYFYTGVFDDYKRIVWRSNT